MSILLNRKRQIRTQQMVIVPGKPHVRKINALKIESPTRGQREIRIEADAHRLPGVVFHDGGNAVRNPARADIGVSGSLLTTERFHALVQIVIADETVDTEIGAAQ